MNAKHAYPELVLTFDRPRKATLNLRAMNALEEYFEKKTGVSKLWQAVDWRNLNVRDMTRILWACLLTDADDHGEQLTYEQVEAQATAAELMSNADKLIALIEELFDRAMPVVESGELQRSLESLEKKRTAALLKTQTPPTGSDSSPSA